MSGSKACRHYRIDRLHGATTGATENGGAGLGPAKVIDNVDNVPVDVKREALLLLDCLTSSKDPDDPEYDVEKDMRRDELLLANDYNDLKNDLRFRGLRTSGDKLEMITRLLLHIIDPSIKFDEMLVCFLYYTDLEWTHQHLMMTNCMLTNTTTTSRSGLGATLKYIDAADLATEKVRIVPIAERNVLDLGPDADDLVALRRRPNLYNSERGVVGGGRGRSDNGASNKTAKKDSRLVMDGLARKETSFVALHVTSAATNTPVLNAPPKSSIFAYVVSSKDTLQSWTRKHAAIILLPSEIGWRSKSMRVLADEIAFITQSTVIVPDIYRGSYYSSLGDEEISVASREGVKYLLQAHLQDRGSTADSSQADGDYYRPPIEVLDPQSYPDSKCSGSMDEWVQTQRSNNGTIFDDIVSAVRFARTEYDAKSISLAGVGYGGGLALEASCFIHDIARSAQLQEIEDAFYSSNYFKDDVNQDGGDGNDVFASYVEGLMAREESSSREVGYHQSRELKLLRDVLHKYDGVFMKPSAQVLELTEKESSSSSSSSMGLDLDEQSMKSIDDVFQQFSNVDSTVAQASRSQVEAEMKGEEYNADGITEEDDTESLSEYDDLMKQLEDEASSAIDDDEAWQDEFRQEMRVVSDAVSSDGNSDHYSVVKSEWGVIAKAVKRATDRALLAPYGSLYTSDFLELVPKAVVALCPNR